jgi:TfdA family taurine catabolism dioxygenase TauD
MICAAQRRLADGEVNVTAPASQGQYPGLVDASFNSLKGTVLRSPVWFDEPEGLERVGARADDLTTNAESLRRSLDNVGIVARIVRGGVSNRELIEIGRQLGEPIEERAPAIQQYVEDEVVLHLKMDRPESMNADLQPFSENPITLHSEGSQRSLDDQPRYILFFCDDASEDLGGGQTIVTPMSTVSSRIAPDIAQSLGRTTYAERASPPFLRGEGGHAVFSFRDFDGPLSWRTTDGSAIDESHVATSLAALLRAMYVPENVRGIRWRPNDLVVIDNRRFFHGRALIGSSGMRKRHLRRVRIRPPHNHPAAALEADE